MPLSRRDFLRATGVGALTLAIDACASKSNKTTEIPRNVGIETSSEDRYEISQNLAAFVLDANISVEDYRNLIPNTWGVVNITDGTNWNFLEQGSYGYTEIEYIQNQEGANPAEIGFGQITIAYENLSSAQQKALIYKETIGNAIAWDWILSTDKQAEFYDYTEGKTFADGAALLVLNRQLQELLRVPFPEGQELISWNWRNSNMPSCNIIERIDYLAKIGKFDEGSVGMPYLMSVQSCQPIQ